MERFPHTKLRTGVLWPWGTLKKTPKYYNPYCGDPQKDSPNLGKLISDLGYTELDRASLLALDASLYNPHEIIAVSIFFYVISVFLNIILVSIVFLYYPYIAQLSEVLRLLALVTGRSKSKYECW